MKRCRDLSSDVTLQTNSNRPRKWAAAVHSAVLSLLFIVIYGGCNWITSQRTDVGTWYYSFERHIPFIPLLIVPYMSIDLFFVAAPFLCRSRAELSVLARRIAFGILMAGVFFLVIPLRIAVPCPEADGWAGSVFRFLHGFDQPYNLFPSLHITLAAILANTYVRHTRGPLRAFCILWFGLIVTSTLLTYQHHLVDIVGGVILAGCCFYLFSEAPACQPVTPNYRIGTYYLTGALFCLGCAAISWHWAKVLLWPAISFGITGSAYYGLGPSIYRKHSGRIPLITWLVLGPTLIGQFLSLYYYRRQCRAWDQVTPHLWVGARISDQEAREARRMGVVAVIDLTAEFSENREFLSVNYLNIPILDLTRLPIGELQKAVDFIRSNTEKGAVYVHCKVGYSRSAAAVGAYLLASGQAQTVEEALRIQRNARPTMVFRPEVTAALEQFSRVMHSHAIRSSEQTGQTR